MNNDLELTLLTKGQVWGTVKENQLEVLKKYGTKSAISDLAILTGVHYNNTSANRIPADNILKGRVGFTYTQSSGFEGGVAIVSDDGNKFDTYTNGRDVGVRPVLLSSSVFSQIFPNRVSGYNGTEEVEYGEYPQWVPEENVQNQLEFGYKKGLLKETGRHYTFDSVQYDNYYQGFQAVTYDEYEYNFRKYVRVKANSSYNKHEFRLSTGEYYRDGDYVWVEVSPVKWLIDDKTKMLVSKIGLLG